LGIEPNDEFYTFNKPVSNPSNQSAAIRRAVNIQITDFKGTNENIRVLINFYNKTIETYKAIVDIASAETKTLLENNYNAIVNELNTRLDAEISFLNSEKENFRSDVNQKEANFRNLIKNSLFNIRYPDNNEKFNYLFLPKLGGQPEYVLLYETISPSERTGSFRIIGQEINLMGVFLEPSGEQYIYTCNEGTLDLFDMFTLQRVENRRLNINNNEKVLFSVSNGPENTAFITEISSRFYIKKPNRNNNNITLIETGDSVIKNVQNTRNIFYNPFYSVYINNIIYINDLKNDSYIANDIEGFIFYENENGSCILLDKNLLQRR